MRMNFSFTVTARLAPMNTDEEKFDTELEFDQSRAEAFLIRFDSAELMFDDYILIFKYDEAYRVTAIYAKNKVQKDKLYLITNSGQLVEDVLKGYRYLISMDLTADLLDFDFKKAIDKQITEELEEE